jgi:hypothetical protein
MTRRFLGVLMLSLASACSAPGEMSGPSRGTVVPAPSPPSQLALRLGPQWLYLKGAGLTFGSEAPSCQPAGVPPSGTLVTTAVDVSRENGEWVARSRTADAGSIELRFHETQAAVSGIPVAGTISGSAVDMPYVDLYTPTDSHVVFETQTPVDGVGDPYSSYAAGRIRGAIQFGDSQGRLATCSEIDWALLP